MGDGDDRPAGSRLHGSQLEQPTAAQHPNASGDHRVVVSSPRTSGLPDPGSFSWATGLRDERHNAGAPTVTGLVHTFDEERFVEQAIRSLAWTDEVVVVDMHSTDRTAEIAASLGARVVLYENVGYVEPARAFGIAQAETDWVFVLDADEWIEEPLARAVCGIAEADDVDVVELPFASWICGSWLSGTGWADEYHPRFFRPDSVTWPAHVHAVPDLRGRVVKLERLDGLEVRHWNYDDLHEFVAKLNHYTDREAETLATSSWSEAVTAARDEVLRRWTPELDGSRSAALSLAMLFYRLLAHTKRWELDGFAGPEVPRTARDALRDLGSDASRLHREALANMEAGRPAEAAVALRAAVRESLDLELLNDLAVVEASLGRKAEAEALLRACLAVDPARADAAENLQALQAAPLALAHG